MSVSISISLCSYPVNRALASSLSILALWTQKLNATTPKSNKKAPFAASLSVLGQVNGYHIKEKRILDKLDESTVKTIGDGDYTIVENLGEFTEEELEEFSDELLEKGLIESKNDMSYEDGKVRVKIKPEKPCCDGRALS